MHQFIIQIGIGIIPHRVQVDIPQMKALILTNREPSADLLFPIPAAFFRSGIRKISGSPPVFCEIQSECCNVLNCLRYRVRENLFFKICTDSSGRQHPSFIRTVRHAIGNDLIPDQITVNRHISSRNSKNQYNHCQQCHTMPDLLFICFHMFSLYP